LNTNSFVETNQSYSTINSFSCQNFTTFAATNHTLYFGGPNKFTPPFTLTARYIWQKPNLTMTNWSAPFFVKTKTHEIQRKERKKTVEKKE